MKRCPGCKILLPVSEFQKNRAAPDGLQFHCKGCRKIIECTPKKRAQDRARYYAADKAAYRNSTYKRRYGISLAEFNALLLRQGNLCAICATDKPGKRHWSLDHSHTTGAVRGVLCLKCNAMLGLADDNPQRLELGAAYLRKFA